MSLMIFISFTYEFVKQIFLFIQFFVCFSLHFIPFPETIATSKSTKKFLHCFMNGKLWTKASYFIKRSKFGIEKGNRRMQKIITNDILLASSAAAAAASLLTNFELVAKFSFSSICLAYCFTSFGAGT